MSAEIKYSIENFIEYQYRSQISPFQGAKNFWIALQFLTLLALICISIVLFCLKGFFPEVCNQLWITHPMPYNWWGYYQLIRRKTFWKILYCSVNQEQYLVPFLCFLCVLPWLYLLMRYVLPTLVGIVLWIGILIFDPTPLGV